MISNFFSNNMTIEMCLRLVVACACGALIGFEREKKYKDAGLRTHLIVCCSAALMMIVSKYGFMDLANKKELVNGIKGADPARIAAQVISGVSFIGAGVIFHDKNNTKGLTTASGLWAIAGVGIAIGAGMYGIGIFATILIAIIQTFLQRFTYKNNIFSIVSLDIVADNTQGVRNTIQEYLNDDSIEIREESISIDGDNIMYNFTLKMEESPSVDEINSFFEKNESIKSISVSING